MCGRQVEGRDVMVVHEVLVKHHLFSISRQAFIEAVGFAAAAIAQVSAVGSQGGPSNL